MSKMAKGFFLLLYLGIFLQTSCVWGKETSLFGRLKKKKIVCTFNSIYYFNSEKFDPEKIDPKMCTHINYQFAHLDNKTFELVPGHHDLDIEQNFYKKVTDLKTKAPGLKVFLSLGGWKDSTKKYSLLVADKNKRQNFISKLLPLLEEHNFDGLDVAWEYPNGWQGAIGVNDADKTHYPVFLKELKEAFTPKNLELSASVSAIEREIEAAYNIPAIMKVLDHLNVMSFDMHGPWEGVTGHHAQFYPTPNDSGSMDLITSLDVWESYGADKAKLNIGIPAYGKSYTLADASESEYGSKTKGAGKAGNNTKQPGYLAFNEICKLIETETWTVQDNSHMGPYAFKGDQWVCYDSPQQVIRKVKYVMDRGYGGFLVKDISSDDHTGYCYGDRYPILEMIIKEILRREHVKAS